MLLSVINGIIDIEFDNDEIKLVFVFTLLDKCENDVDKDETDLDVALDEIEIEVLVDKLEIDADKVAALVIDNCDIF